MSESEHNGGISGQIESIVDRLERLDEERRALQADFKDVLDAGAEATGLSKAAFRNILRERRKSRQDMHALYSDMDAIRRALKMPDPLLPVDEDDDSPGVTLTPGQVVTLGEAIESLHLHRGAQ